MSNIKQEPRDENGKEHGEWVEYNHNGKLAYRWNYFHGIRHGLWEGYDIGGGLMYRGYRNRDKEIGYWYYYGKKKYYLWLI